MIQEPPAQREHRHYFRSVEGISQVDVYRILELFGVTCPVAQHIVKKALACGQRGAKSPERDMRDIVVSANRWLEMRAEDARRSAGAVALPGGGFAVTGAVGFAPYGVAGLAGA